MGYKKNFLKQVIARIDFLNPFEVLTEQNIVGVVTEIKKRFPITEKSTRFEQTLEFKFSPKEDANYKTQRNEFPEWIFHGIDREKTVKINQRCWQVVLTKFKSKADFQDDLMLPLSHVIKLMPNHLVGRTGVRFINIFDFEIEKFEEINQYFSDGISKHIERIADLEKCTRSFLVNEFMFDDIKMRVQSGLFNPDYPAIIKKRYFLIDLDAYIEDRKSVV